MACFTAFKKDPVKIVKTKGSMVTAQQDNHNRRNSAEGNNSTGSLSMSMPRKSNNDMHSKGSIRKSTRVSKRPTRLIDTM